MYGVGGSIVLASGRPVPDAGSSYQQEEGVAIVLLD